MQKRPVKYYLKQLLKKEGSKKAVAELLGVSERYIEMLLAGRPPGKSLHKLIKLYARIR